MSTSSGQRSVKSTEEKRTLTKRRIAPRSTKYIPQKKVPVPFVNANVINRRISPHEMNITGARTLMSLFPEESFRSP